MQARGAGLARGDAVDDRQPAIVVAVPVHADVVRAQLVEQPQREAHDGACAVRRGMPDRVGHADARRAGPHRGRVEQPQRRRVRPQRIFRDEEDGQAFLEREGERLLGAALEEVERPPFRILAQRARPDERRHLELHARPLRDLDDRADVGDDGARGAVRPDRQPGAPQSPAPAARRRRPRAAPRRAGRCRRTRCRDRRSGAGCEASRRSRASEPRVTAIRRAASRHRAGWAQAAGRGLDEVPVMDERVRHGARRDDTARLTGAGAELRCGSGAIRCGSGSGRMPRAQPARSRGPGDRCARPGTATSALHLVASRAAGGGGGPHGGVDGDERRASEDVLVLGGQVPARGDPDVLIEAIVPDEKGQQEPEGGREPRAPAVSRHTAARARSRRRSARHRR